METIPLVTVSENVSLISIHNELITVKLCSTNKIHKTLFKTASLDASSSSQT